MMSEIRLTNIIQIILFFINVENSTTELLKISKRLTNNGVPKVSILKFINILLNQRF